MLCGVFALGSKDAGAHRGVINAITSHMLGQDVDKVAHELHTLHEATYFPVKTFLQWMQTKHGAEKETIALLRLPPNLIWVL